MNKDKIALFGTFAAVCVFLILATLHLDSIVYPGAILETDQTRLTDAVFIETGIRNVTMERTSSCRPSSEYEEMVLKDKGVYPEDIMALKPFKFLKNYKNPCFMRNNSVISCFPYYFLVGVSKSGTTDLSRRIALHPQVSSRVKKETHWLVRKRFQANMKLKSYPTIYNYLDRYFRQAADDILQNVKGSFHPKVVGDCSPSTLWGSSYWSLLKENQNRSEPLHTTADFIHHINPNAKILAILRNPIDRLYSGYLFFNKGLKKTTKDFHASVVKDISYYNVCFQRCSYRHCLYTVTARPENRVRLHLGLYYYYIADFMKVIPRNQILVIKTEDYSANMTHNMRKVFTFLELDPLNERQMADVTDTSKIYNTNKKAPKVGPMLPETRALLHNFYKPHNDKLEQLLGAKFWGDEAF